MVCSILKGYLPGRLEFTDKDKPETNNTRITITMLSQDPEEPKIEVHQFDNRMAQLTFKGCFDYDVRLSDLSNLNKLKVHIHSDL